MPARSEALFFVLFGWKLLSLTHFANSLRAEAGRGEAGPSAKEAGVGAAPHAAAPQHLALVAAAEERGPACCLLLAL
jgi:hypothetical protein